MTRHPLDLFSLVAGVLIVGTAIILLIPDLGPETLARLTPVAIIALGLAVLVSARPARDAPPTAGAGEAHDADRGEAELAPAERSGARDDTVKLDRPTAPAHDPYGAEEPEDEADTRRL